MLLATKKFIVGVIAAIIGFFVPSSPVLAPQPLPDPTPAAAVGAALENPPTVPTPLAPALPAWLEPRLPDGRVQRGEPPTGEAYLPGMVNGLDLAAIKACLNRAGESGECLDGILRAYLKFHSTSDALAAMRHYESVDLSLRLSCHPVMHAIGRETFRKTGTVQGAFIACDQTCHSGCYHGAMERFLRGEAASDDEAGHISAEELKARAVTACDANQPTRFRFQCLHGLGHAVLFFLDYRLEAALQTCDVLPGAWDRSSCYGGLFMENVFSATPAKRDLSRTDYHYPCSKLEPKYRSDCYMMQTTRMSEMNLNTEELFAECRRAGEYQHTCMQSIGRDLSNDVRIGDPRRVADKCELGQGEERRACTRGVAFALLDNTWDGRYAFPFCAAFKGDADVSYCFSVSSDYLRSTFDRSRQDILGDCQAYAARAVICREIVGG